MTYINSLQGATSTHSMFYDADCGLSKKATGSHSRSVLLMHSHTDGHNPAQNTLQL